MYGFAITVPRVPKETPIKNGAQYRLYWDEKTNAVVNLMAYQSPTDCSAWLAWARNTFKDANSTRVITMKGMPTIEGDANRNSLQAGYQRRHCVNGRMYSFEAGWPKDQGKPPIVGRIMDSFRLLREKSGASQSK